MSVKVIERPVNRIDLELIKKKTINLAVFGHGQVGSKLIDQIIASRDEISRRRDLTINIFAIANSTSVLICDENVDKNWKEIKQNKAVIYSIQEVIRYAKNKSLENLILVDNSSSSSLVDYYPTFIENGFHLVSSNKIGNTRELKFYQNIRELLCQHQKEYLYETNVGAGLPLIDTIKLLHVSGENISRIKGVFSGSLSYIFNHYSNGKMPFGEVLERAIQNGFTEPDPREDLCGNDVGRKLLILARELDLHIEFDEVNIQNLIPRAFRDVSRNTFFGSLRELDDTFETLRENQKPDHVLRYVGELHGDLSKSKGAILDVNLISVKKNSMLGQLSGSDSIFEIYTESYGNRPIVIQGAGAGPTVTARGVFGDILRLCERTN